jgi:RNA ligase
MNETNDIRKLAHIEKIEWIRPIEGADKIETAGILGWECVIAKKDNFKVGDKIIYCEVDCIMPEKPEFEFLRERKFRIKTIKLKKQISQGLVLPITLLPFPNKLEIGQDVTEWLGITKYLSVSEQEEVEQYKSYIPKNKIIVYMMKYKWFRKLVLTKKSNLGFPPYLSKTDEERIQNIPKILEHFKDKVVYITEKVDYQSATFSTQKVYKFPFLGKLSPKKTKLIVCSRNNLNNDKNSLYWKIVKKYQIDEILKNNTNLSIQGEQGSTNVQGNKYSINGPQLWVFNIIDHEKKYHYNFDEMKYFCLKNGLQTVPFIGIKKLSDCGSTVQ